MMGLLLELARLTGTEMLHNTANNCLLSSPNSDGCRAPDAFQLDELQLLRFPTDLAGSRADSQSWDIIKYHCMVANASEIFYRSISREQWLLTVVTSHDPCGIFYRMQDDKATDLKIQSNVVPRRAYLARLENGALMATCPSRHQCIGGFFPSSHIGKPAQESCANCVLAERLSVESTRHHSAVELEKLLKFWFMETKDVELAQHIKGGPEGDVCTILWRNGTFARKRFQRGEVPRQNIIFNRELDVALTVSHPNIVHCFGCSRGGAGSPDCELFMEVLQEDLESFLSRLEDKAPPFSLTDAVEMLLQVAEAVKHLHEEGFMHGDLKPGNILVSELTTPHSDVLFYLVKVTDFGCTQRFSSSGVTESFDFKIGSNPYTAPEVCRCRKMKREIESYQKRNGSNPKDFSTIEDLEKAVSDIDPPKIDVFSFGVVAHEVISRVADVHEGATSDGKHLLRFFSRCSGRKPENRPSFEDICKQLSSTCVKNDHELHELRKGKCKHQDNINEGSNLAKSIKTMWLHRGTC